MTDSLKRLILKLFDIGAIEFGAFRFKHHEKYPDAPLAPMKINLRTPDHRDGGRLTSAIVNEIAVLFLKIMERENIQFDYIAGIPRAGEPFAEVVAKILDKPLIRAKKAETNGNRKIDRLIFPCIPKPGQSVVIFDDVITKGESKKEVIQIFETVGLEIAAVVVFADREEGGMELYSKLGYRLIAVTTSTDILEIGLTSERITEQKYREILVYLEFSKSIGWEAPDGQKYQ